MTYKEILTAAGGGTAFAGVLVAAVIVAVVGSMSALAITVRATRFES